MRPVHISGVGMTRFGKYQNRSLKDLGREAVTAALVDAGVIARDLQAAFVGNSMAGIVTGQEAVRGQVVLSAMGIGGLPIVNVDNACASGSTALHQAWVAVGAGLYDVVLVLGVEKLFHPDRAVTLRALAAATDVEKLNGTAGGSVFLEESSHKLAVYMERTGATLNHVARIAEKSHRNSSLNPLAQYQDVYSLEEILASPVTAPPMTRLMCSPIGDGAAALIVCSESHARKIGRAGIRIGASILRSTSSPDGVGIAEAGSRAAYEMAGIGPEGLSLAEVHDTTAASELMLYERLGFCAPDEAPRLVDEDATAIGGRLPVNTSGGLISRGHPVGATGVAQICELAWQLRGEAGARQVNGARVGLAHNAGGTVLGEPAALCIHMLVADGSEATRNVGH